MCGFSLLFFLIQSVIKADLAFLRIKEIDQACVQQFLLNADFLFSTFFKDCFHSETYVENYITITLVGLLLIRLIEKQTYRHIASF